MHDLGDRKGVKAGRLLCVQAVVPLVKCGRASHSRPRHHPKTWTLLVFQLYPTGLHALVGGEQAKLAETIQQVKPLGGKIICGLVPGNLRGNLHP